MWKNCSFWIFGENVYEINLILCFVWYNCHFNHFQISCIYFFILKIVFRLYNIHRDTKFFQFSQLVLWDGVNFYVSGVIGIRSRSSTDRVTFRRTQKGKVTLKGEIFRLILYIYSELYILITIYPPSDTEKILFVRASFQYNIHLTKLILFNGL